MTDATLKPCPFCGGTNLRVQTAHDEIPAGAMGLGTSAGSILREVIWCHSCGTFPHGAKWWNSRALPERDLADLDAMVGKFISSTDAARNEFVDAMRLKLGGSQSS